jgi:hypothetical protein
MANSHPKLSVADRARKYLDSIPPNVCGTGSCRQNTFRVACVLTQGFALSVDEASGLMESWVAGGSHKFTEGALRAELQSSTLQQGLRTRGGVEPRGCLLRESGFAPNAAERTARQIPTVPEARKQVKFDQERLQQLAGERGKWTRGQWQIWLANRSAVDPATVSADAFLRALYHPERGEKVIVIPEYGGDVLWPDEPFPATARDGVKFHANPVDGVRRPNPRSKWRNKDGSAPMSRGIWECVMNFRYLVLESDVAKPEEWLGFLAGAPLRIEAIYTSGGKSLHVLLRMDCPSRAEFERKKEALAPFLNVCLIAGADRGPLSVLGPTRLPGCLRQGKTVEAVWEERPGGHKVCVKQGGFFPFPKGPALQKLLYLRPRAEVRALTDLPAVRSVEHDWQAKALLVVDGYEDAAVVRAGLQYYAAASPACAEALVELEREESGVGSRESTPGQRPPATAGGEAA